MNNPFGLPYASADLDDIMRSLPADRQAKIAGRVNQLKAEMLMKLLEDPEIAENFSIVECIRFLENPAALPDNESTSPDHGNLIGD